MMKTIVGLGFFMMFSIAQADTFFKVEYRPDGSGTIQKISDAPVTYLDAHQNIQHLASQSIITTEFQHQDTVRIENHQVYLNQRAL